MRKLISIALLVIFCFKSFSQKADAKYKEHVAEIQKEIWDVKNPAFQVKDVPAEMKNESAVIIARSFEVINSAKLKLKFSLFIGAAQRISYQTTYHERVKINDKAALEEYSSIEYTKKIDQTIAAGFTKIYDKTDTYIGAKIIKADGSEVVVNTDEEVLTTNTDKAKEGKLAISNLQAGDILDYYIRIEKVQENSTEIQGPYTFVMGGDYPVLYYAARLQLDERAGVEYISANGAPAFKEGKNDDGDITLELTQKNLPKFQSSLWTSPLRQYPYITVQYKFVSKAEDQYSHFNRGEVKHGYLSDDLIEQFKKTVQSPGNLVNYYPLTITQNYFGGEKNMKDIPKDSITKVLYNAWRYNTFCSFPTDNINVSNDINYNRANSLIGAISLSRMLTALDIDNTIFLVCSRNANSLKNVTGIGDFDALVKVNAGKQYWLAFDDIVTQFNEIPSRFQGEDAITLMPQKEKRSVTYDDGRGKVPVTSSSDNVINENLNVSFDAGNMQLLQVTRDCKQTGSLRHGDQMQLMLMEDMEASLADAVTQKKFVERLNEDKKSKRLFDEFSSAFAKERSNQSKTYFTNEINGQFNAKPKDVSGYQIMQPALFSAKTPFEYSSSFSMENFVKKAGNNYILEAGKLVGSYTKVDDKERTRTVDIYMPCARTFSYTISINIPKGYTAKGVEELNKNISNETGSFSSVAGIEGDAVNIKISRTYSNNFEKSANWPKLLELMDGFYNFTTQKILLEKTK